MVKCELELRKVISTKTNKEFTSYVLHIGEYEIVIRPSYETDVSLFKAITQKANTK